MTRLPDAVREQVRLRAAARCEYCREPEALSSFGFHTDHIISQKHGGSDHLENLAWACPPCNILKGTDVASYDSETGNLTPLYNPRKDQWDDHFELDGDVFAGKTSIGRVTVRILDMNSPEKVETRRFLIQAGQWQLLR